LLRTAMAMVPFIAVLAAAVVAYAASAAPHTVEMAVGVNRYMELRGAFSFTVDSPINIGGVVVEPGTRVLVQAEHTRLGTINIKGGELRGIDLYNATLYVGDKLVIANGHVKSRGRAGITSFESSLVLYLAPEPPGKLRLVIDGETVIDKRVDNSEVIVNGVALTAEGSLRLVLSSNRHYLYGGADEVLINGRQVSAVTPGGLLLFLAAAGIGTAYWMGRRR